MFKKSIKGGSATKKDFLTFLLLYSGHSSRRKILSFFEFLKHKTKKKLYQTKGIEGGCAKNVF